MSVSTLDVGVLLLVSALSIGTCWAQSSPETDSKAFAALDSNRDGVVSKLEYDSDVLFRVLDANRNYRISASELEAVIGPQADGGLSTADRIRIGDNNNDGELTDEELRRSVQMRFQWLDTNHDDNVDFAEMKAGFGRP